MANQLNEREALDSAIGELLSEAPAHKLNTEGTVAVSTTQFWEEMHTCPRGVKVQLLGAGGVAVYGTYDGRNPFWQAWAPVPRRRE